MSGTRHDEIDRNSTPPGVYSTAVAMSETGSEGSNREATSNPVQSRQPPSSVDCEDDASLSASAGVTGREASGSPQPSASVTMKKKSGRRSKRKNRESFINYLYKVI